MNSVLVSVGAALPKKCVLNSELPAHLDTSDEWIVQRTGIHQRYIAGEDETTVSLATAAAENALSKGNIPPGEIDLIIVCTATGDYTFPASATLVQRNLGITSGVAFDISAACSGFIYGLKTADCFIRTGQASCALVIGAETFSRIVDWNDRSTCVLFGDGAGAVVLKASECDDKGLVYCKIHADGSLANLLTTTGGVSISQNSGFVKMNGREVFRNAVEKMHCSLCDLLKANNMTVNDVDLLVPHQANKRIIDNIVEMSGLNPEKVVITLDKHANTSAASIPLALNEVSLDSCKNVVLLSMGAGFTWGEALLKL